MPLDNATQITISVNGQSFTVWDEWQQGQVREVFAKATAENVAFTQWLIPWNQRQALALALLGNTIQVQGSPNYLLAASYPGFAMFRANRVEISCDGIGSVGPNGYVAFPRARLRTRWQVPQFDPSSPVALGDIELDFCSNAFALDQASSSFAWAPNQPLPPSAMPALHFTTILYSLSRYEVPSINVNQIRAAMDMTNAASFQGAPAESVIYRGAKSSRSTTPAGGLNWTISHRVEVHSVNGGWNKLPKPGSVPLWQPYFLSDGTTKPFPSTDLSFIYT